MNDHIYTSTFIENLQKHLDSKTNGYITYPKFFFLCGKGYDPNDSDSYNSSNRGIIHRYIQKLYPDMHIVLSERLWENTFDPSIDLLTFEEFLAEISDFIILFVESAGSFCELGAFAYADSLFGDKLMIIVDKKYENDFSFINIGPVSKAKKNKSKVIYSNIEESSFLSDDSIREAINQRIKSFSPRKAVNNKRKINTNQKEVYINSFIIEILELLKIVQPISESDLWNLYKRVKRFDQFELVKRDGTPFFKKIQNSYIVKLLKVSDIIDERNGFLYLKQSDKIENLMFDYSNYAIQRERSQLICRKYKNGELI